MNDTTNNNKNLFYLHDLSDYKVSENYPDVRGWKVNDSGDRTIGTVEGLLVNKEEERVVYLDVEVNPDIIEEGHKIYASKSSDGLHEFRNEDGETHMVIPIGLVVLNKEKEIAKAKGITHETFAKTRRYKKGTHLSRDYELVVISTYLPSSENTSSPQNGKDFYKQNAFTESKGH